jgi:hypothetical protein
MNFQFQNGTVMITPNIEVVSNEPIATEEDEPEEPQLAENIA